MPQASASSQVPVNVWTVDLHVNRELILNEEEQARAARFRFECDRVRWGRARSALRGTLGRYVGTDPLAICFRYGPYGKPALPGGPEFNISHSGQWAMIAIAGACAVGIDVEQIREDVEIGRLLERLGETEATGSTVELFQRWTRREARTKALGIGLMEMPPEGDLRTSDLQAPTGFAAAVALIGADPDVRYCGGV